MLLAPAQQVLVDKATGTSTYGHSVRAAGGIAFELPIVSLFADAFEDVIAFETGPAVGVSRRKGITVGLVLQR